jgi:coproporphyrinogen III oxidase
MPNAEPLPNAPPQAAVEHWMRQLQDELCGQLSQLDGSGQAFTKNVWQHKTGHGCTRLLEHGDALEKSGVTFSVVWGELDAAAAQELALPTPHFVMAQLGSTQFPRNPWVPIAHLNVHYIEADNGEAWFGGSLDLTPIYVDVAQAHWFHTQVAALCQRHAPDYYARFKAAADAYFYLPHRNETLGIGGVYFDRLTVGRDGTFDELFAFVQDVGQAYARQYSILLRQNIDRPFATRQRRWQVARWSHYAEFTLLFDRETRRGLATGQHLEGVLLGLPPEAEWPYQLQTVPTSPESLTQHWLHPGVNWLAAEPIPETAIN